MRRPFRFNLSPKARSTLIVVGLSSLFGLLWYLLLYGRFPLYLSHVNYLYNAGGDALQHQLGWEWFRQEAWAFPLGKISAYGYPFGTSVAFMDSIPLLAIPFKLLSPLLQSDFQYIGLWELASLVGQMLLGMLILGEFTRSYPRRLLGASLLVLSPPLIFRAFYHSSLSAHWILLAAIWFAIREYRQKMWRWAWAALFAVAVWVHVYFIPMLIPLWLIGLYFRYRQADRRWRLVVDVGAVGVVSLLAAYSIGLLDLGYQSLSAYGYGMWSWNLNGLVNPFEFGSAYLKGMEVGTDGQYEGYSYLGLGILAILPAAVYLFLVKDGSRRRLAFWLPFAAAALVYALFSLSNTAYVSDRLLWDIPLPGRLMTFFNLFRTSGRFILPVFYFVALFAIVMLVRNLRYAAPVLALALLVQFSDLQPLIQPKHQSEFAAYPSGLQSEFWQAAASANQHLVIVPARKLTRDYEPLALYAVHHRLTLNLGYFARSDAAAFQAYAEQVWQDLQAGQPDATTLYILTEPEWIEHARAELAGEMAVCEVDGYTVLFSAQNALASSATDLAPYCALPYR